MSECLTENQVVALLEGRLPQQELARLHQHIDTCPLCHALVADMALPFALEATAGPNATRSIAARLSARGASLCRSRARLRKICSIWTVLLVLSGKLVDQDDSGLGGAKTIEEATDVSFSQGVNKVQRPIGDRNQPLKLERFFAAYRTALLGTCECEVPG